MERHALLFSHGVASQERNQFLWETQVDFMAWSSHRTSMPAPAWSSGHATADCSGRYSSVRAGHCTLTPAETITALRALLDRLRPGHGPP